MIRKRTIGALTAIGGVTAAVALLAGTPAANADELGDLRANQELLQRRLDQLAQAPGPGNPFGVGGPPGPTTVQMMGGSFPRSFLIPGTDTSIRVGGEIRMSVLNWLNGGSANAGPTGTNAGATGTADTIALNIKVPVAVGTAGAIARNKGTNVWSFTAQQSKISAETRTPTGWGEARTFMEWDWAGGNAFVPGGARGSQGTSTNLIPRLRFAYSTLGGLLFGQANSNFNDPDASAETLDFGGNYGDPGFTRIAQVRYTMPLAPWGFLGALSVSAEAPETDIWTSGQGIIGSDAGAVATSTTTPTTTCTSTPAVAGVAPTITCTTSAVGGNLQAVNPTKAATPDFVAAWYIPQPWGHVDFSAVVRPGLQLRDGAFVNRQYIGWGVHFGGDVKPGWFGWAQDDITWHVVYGEGIGRYQNSPNTFALVTNYPATVPTSQAAANNIRVRPVAIWAGNVGYLHRWAPNLRSTISAGILHKDVNNLGGINGFV